jgi:hypothetical protein
MLGVVWTGHGLGSNWAGLYIMWSGNGLGWTYAALGMG